MKGARAVSVDGERWWYKIGAVHIPIWSPGGAKHVARVPDVAGRSYDTIERGQWKKTRDGMICPQHVRRYIRRVLLRPASLNERILRELAK